MATHAQTSTDSIVKAIGAAAVGFGAAGTLAPGLLTSIYGMKEKGGDFGFMSRMWGTRTAVLGAITLATPAGPLRRQTTMMAVAMNAVDSLVAFSGRDLSTRTRLLAGLTSGAFAALGAWTLTGES